MSEAQSPVQPLESTGGSTDARLASMLASAGMPNTPAAAAAATAVPKVSADLCPNCAVAQGQEVALVDGVCPTCGHSVEARNQ